MNADPIDVEVYFNRGSTSLTRGDFEKAIADSTQAIQLGPTFSAAYAWI